MPGAAAATTVPPTPIDDPNGCAAALWDPAGQLADPSLLAAPSQALAAAGYDLHVRVEPLVDGTVDDRQRQLEQACPTWTAGGSRRDGLLVLTVVPSRRQTGIYYGSQARALDRWWTTIQVERMNPSFRLGAYDQGLAAGLQAVADLLVRGTPPTPVGTPAPSFTPSPEPAGGGGGRGWVVALVGLGVVGLAGWGWWSRLTEWVEDAEQGTRTRVRRSSGSEGGGWFGGTGLFGGSGGSGWGSHGSGWGGGGSDGGGSSGGGSSGGGDGGSGGGGSTSW